MRKTSASKLRAQTNTSYVEFTVTFLIAQDEIAEFKDKIGYFHINGFQAKRPYRLGGGAEVKLAIDKVASGLADKIIDTSEKEMESISQEDAKDD